MNDEHDQLIFEKARKRAKTNIRNGMKKNDGGTKKQDKKKKKTEKKNKNKNKNAKQNTEQRRDELKKFVGLFSFYQNELVNV